MVTWTVDVEKDWGGRSESEEGIRRGLPILLEAFSYVKLTNVLFFVSTELMRTCRDSIERIHKAGFKLGSHGHFHTIYKEKWRQEEDRQLSLKLLAEYQSIPKESIRYRAPKFNYKVSGEQFSDRKGHTGLLKHMWLGEPVRDIIYLHPFDIVKTKEPSPNLFCKLWYSRPKKAYETFINLLNRYH